MDVRSYSSAVLYATAVSELTGASGAGFFLASLVFIGSDDELRDVVRLHGHKYGSRNENNICSLVESPVNDATFLVTPRHTSARREKRANCALAIICTFAVSCDAFAYVINEAKLY